jgi:hypothetical protein
LGKPLQAGPEALAIWYKGGAQDASRQATRTALFMKIIIEWCVKYKITSFMIISIEYLLGRNGFLWMNVPSRNQVKDLPLD